MTEDFTPAEAFTGGTMSISDWGDLDANGAVQNAKSTKYVQLQLGNKIATLVFSSTDDVADGEIATGTYNINHVIDSVSEKTVWAGEISNSSIYYSFIGTVTSDGLIGDFALLDNGTVTVSKSGSEYTIEVDTNVDGTLKITLNGQVIVSDAQITGNVRAKFGVEFGQYGENNLVITFTPDPDQDLGEYTQLATTENQSISETVLVNKGYFHNKVVYVSPAGDEKGNGSKEFPLDIYSAVNNVVEGQTIVLMEGTYKLLPPLKIQRGMDGTAELPIKMIADPEAQTRPVLDFQRMGAGIVHGGDYWYFYGFDVTRSSNGQKGIQVSGSYNTLDQINTYYNGNTGIQISRYSGSDLFPDWPAYNLILNCTSYCNYDKGFEDADGFAAKLTIGEGNVFDGCVAYNNADDGWDLYAKGETGPIGSVTIRNCVAYSNGFVPGVEGTGNGNGFKMGGESLTGKHVLENCFAFWNLAKGIDSNSCPDIIVKNCVSYNNGSYNVAFYTNNAANTDFSAQGIVSFRDGTSPYDYTGADNLKGKGTQDQQKYMGNSNYYWQDGFCVNGAGKQITADMFVSLTFSGAVARNADGTINMEGFLVLKDNAPSGTGATMGGTPSRDNTLEEEGQHEYSDIWSNLDPVYHWHECACGARTDLTEHSFVWIIDKEPTPTETGLKHEECTECGYKRAAVTTYYEEQQPEPTDPTEPAPTQPKPTDPAPTQPGATQPGEQQDQQPGNGGLIVAIVVVAVLVIGAAVWFILKKKKK